MVDTPNQNANLQAPNSIINSINALTGSVVNSPVPTEAVPTLNFQAPTGGELDSKYEEFLNRAAQDPDIIKYYAQLLDYAKGDTDIAKQQIENDYQTGVRQTTDTLKGTLDQLGLTFKGESQNLLDTLNKRGIALTQDGNKLTYAGGGQPATELGNLNQSQQLRQEAEQRSASQNIEKMGIARSKGITSANQGLRNTALTLQQQKQGDIYQRANVNYGAYQGQQYAKAQQSINQQNAPGGSAPNKGDINPATGKAYAVNPSTGSWDDNYFAQTYG